MSSRWQQIEINGKTADILEHSGDVHPGCVIFLHGHGLVTLKNNDIYTELFARHGLRVVCPHGLQSWWLDQIWPPFDDVLTPEQHVVQNVVPWISSFWGVKSSLTGLFGVSMGGQGAFRIAFRHGMTFSTVAALSPAVDFHQWYGQGLAIDHFYESAEAARQQTATLQIHPLSWPRNQWLACDPMDRENIDGAVRLRSKLNSSGIPVESDFETSHGGHTWTYFNFQAPKVVAWLANRLRYESNRE